MLVPPVTSRDHTRGPADAPVTLVQYGDFECRESGAAYPVIEAVLGRMQWGVRFAFRSFPMAKDHPNAEHAAEMAEAAAFVGKFWPMHQILFDHQAALDDAALLKYAATVGIDPQLATSTLVSGLFQSRVRQDFISGVRSGVDQTPTFFINGVRHDGEWDTESLIQAITAAAPASVR